MNSYDNVLKMLSNSFGRVLAIELRSQDTAVQDCPNKEIVQSETFDPNRSRFGIYLFYFRAQVSTSLTILKLARKVRGLFIYMGDTMVLPILAAKIAGIPTAMIVGGSMEDEMKHSMTKTIRAAKSILSLARQLALGLSDAIILYSTGLLAEWNMNRYRGKVIVAPKHFVDSDKFSVRIPFEMRPVAVGYIGRFSPEKGIENFVHAIPEILKIRPETRFTLVGDGILRDSIEKFLMERGLKESVVLTGWVDRDELPSYLNRLRLLVLPSYSEGLPNVFLEAMACGTPVLANRVGTLGELIRHNENGYLMIGNEPNVIAEAVSRSLNSGINVRISEEARRLVVDNYTFKVVAGKFSEAVAALDNSREGRAIN